MKRNELSGQLSHVGSITSPHDRVFELAIIIPAYNEEENLGELLDLIDGAMAGMGIDYGVLVVNDGSSDRTGWIADSKCGARVCCVHHARNMGFAQACLTGYALAKARYITIFPADLQFLPADFALCWDAMTEDVDVLVTCRDRRRDPPLRNFLSGAYARLIGLCSGLAVRDFNWVKLWRAEVLDEVDFLAAGPFLDAQILLEARSVGARIATVAVPHHERTGGKATGASWKPVVGTLRDLVRHRGYIFAKRRTAAPAPRPSLRRPYAVAAGTGER